MVFRTILGLDVSDNKGKVHRDAFRLAEDQYSKCIIKYIVPRFIALINNITEYKPILKEVETILAEAEHGEEVVMSAAAAGGGPAGAGSRQSNSRS